MSHEKKPPAGLTRLGERHFDGGSFGPCAGCARTLGPQSLVSEQERAHGRALCWDCAHGAGLVSVSPPPRRERPAGSATDRASPTRAPLGTGPETYLQRIAAALERIAALLEARGDAPPF